MARGAVNTLEIEDEPSGSGFIVCTSCGVRIKAGRKRCLRCGELLYPTEGLRSWLKPTNRQMLVVGAIASMAALATVVVLLQTPSPTPIDDVARPADDGVSRGARPTASPTSDAQASEGAVAYGEPATFRDAGRGGSASFNGGDFSAARAAYEDALAKKPDDPETLNNLGQTLVRLGDVEQAVTRFQRAAALAPDKWNYRFNLAHARGQLGQWDGAIADYREAARLFPTDYATQFNLAMALHKKGDEQAAIPEYQKAIQLAPSEASFHQSLAVSLEKVGRTADAISEFQQYLGMAPSASDAAQVKAHIDALSQAGKAQKS
jgi:Flp pilus assembly protein TadD